MDNKLKEKIDLLTGLSDWYIKSPLRENNCLVVNDGPCGLRKPFERSSNSGGQGKTRLCKTE